MNIYIYIYIYIRYRDLLSYRLASCPGVFGIKLYTLVYFSPKVMLLVRKGYYKNQCINLIGLAPVAKATQCLGGQVARFLKPFEARPADPVRRELYRQLAEKPGIAATSGWLAPSEALPSTPAPLGPGTEECASRALPPKKGRRRTSNRQATASGN